ncbi:ComEA family DNA-binding protein [Vibrio sp. HB161653]|uniref:ComEA family DNA-binding protein n=1 Tax=Vibrio sp. HB236076 TaxID=3232307 RepID=A0AB39HKG1_9VIBR|nr:ComEA family DNA-binding protein [Vibrio sp. HB161653]MDP5253829.1 ComEA family DNA-binding protein [Vibrio sp. HB161653]
MVANTQVNPTINPVDKTLQGIEVTVNINQASTHELATLLTGVGEKKAQRIVDYRELNGPFTSVDSLTQVKGIGPALLAKNRQRITL